MKRIFFLIAFLFLAYPAWARTATWDGGGGDNLLSTAANWDTDTAPVNGDAVVFDGTSSKNCTWDTALSVASINTTSYGGQVTPTANITVTGNLTLANSTWVHGSKKVTFTSTSTITPGSSNPLYDVTFGSSAAITISGTLTIAHTFIPQDAVNTNSLSGGTINLEGDLDASAGGRSSSSGTVTSLVFTGTGTQTFTGSASLTTLGADITINKPSGTLNLVGTICPYRNITWTAGTVSPGTSNVIFGKDFGTSGTITSGSGLTFYDFGMNHSQTLTLADNMTVTHTLDIGAGSIGSATINGYKIYIGGSFSNTAGNQVFGTTGIEFNGSSSGTWSAANTTYVILSGGGGMTFAKSGGTLTISGSVRYDGTITYTSGTISASGSTLDIKADQTLNTNGMTWGNINKAANVTLSSNLQVGGNWTNTTGSLSGNYTVTFSGTSTLNGATTFYNMSLASGSVTHLTSGQTFTVSNAFTTSGTSTLDATTGSSVAYLNVNGSQSVTGVTATDIDSSGGSVKPIHNVGGTNTRTVQWDTSGGAPANTGAGFFLL